VRADAEASRFKLGLSERRQSYVLPRSNGKYHVQVASFAKEEQAKDIARSFAAQGHSTKISRVRMAGQRWYCVRIGPFDTREEALEYQALVKDIPGGKSEVIPFPPPPGNDVQD
jgi:cell division septation protein DedD